MTRMDQKTKTTRKVREKCLCVLLSQKEAICLFPFLGPRVSSWRASESTHFADVRCDPRLPVGGNYGPGTALRPSVRSVGIRVREFTIHYTCSPRVSLGH